MSAGGRGTRRSSAYQGNVPAQPLFLAPGPTGEWTSFVPAASKWQRRLDLESPPTQVLTNVYAAYEHTGSVTEISIPYGGERLVVVGTYTPAVANGQLGVSVRWLGPGNASEITLDVSDTSTAVFGAGGENATVEVEAFERAVVTPDAPNTDPIIYRIPFWIPPVEFLVNAVQEANPRLELFIREAGGVAEGSFTLNRLLIESFGESRPVSTLP